MLHRRFLLEIIKCLADMLEAQGDCSALVRKLRDFVSDDNEDNLEEAKKEIAGRTAILMIRNDDDSPFVTLGYGDHEIVLNKRYIFSYRKDWGLYSDQACLYINEMSEGATMKDNPIRNLIIEYDDVDDRDRDFDKLQTIIYKR